MNTTPNQIPPEFALYWTKVLGLKESSLVRLKGGINNHVYRCGERNSYVIKGYAPSKPGLRDRMQAEVEFLRYAAEVAPGFAPTLFQVDNDRRCVVMEHLNGETFPEGCPPRLSAEAYAIKILNRLNSDQESAKQIISQNAAEGFQSLTEHLDNIQERLSSMRHGHLPTSAKSKAHDLLTCMADRYQKVYEFTSDEIASGRQFDSIRPDDCCISPSDFGFHNAILTEQGVKFIDFEFSGLDDPAKTAIDFVLQPRVPVKQSLTQVLYALDIKQKHMVERRCMALMPILSLKWSCIILSVLNPDRLKEMIQIHPCHDLETFIHERMIAARLHLKRSTIFPYTSS